MLGSAQLSLGWQTEEQHAPLLYSLTPQKEGRLKLSRRKTLLALLGDVWVGLLFPEWQIKILNRGNRWTMTNNAQLITLSPWTLPKYPCNKWVTVTSPPHIWFALIIGAKAWHTSTNEWQKNPWEIRWRNKMQLWDLCLAGDQSHFTLNSTLGKIRLSPERRELAVTSSEQHLHFCEPLDKRGSKQRRHCDAFSTALRSSELAAVKWTNRGWEQHHYVH